MEKYKVGDLVEVSEGSMKNLMGTVVYLDEKNEKYLVRFSEYQQMYYSDDEIVPWNK